RTVEGPGRRAARAARGRHGVAVEHEFGRNVLAAPLLEDRAPGVLGFPKHRSDEATLLILRCAVVRRRGRLLRRHCAHQTEEQSWIDSEKVRRGQGEQRAADAELQARAPARARAYVLDVGALAQIVPAHRALPVSLLPMARYTCASRACKSGGTDG